MKGEKLICKKLKIYLKPPHSTSLSFFIPIYQFIHPVIHPLTALMPPQLFTHLHPKIQTHFKSCKFYFLLFFLTPITRPPPHPSPPVYACLHLLLRKRDKSGCILTVFNRGGGAHHVPGVLLVSMTTGSGSIKISGANGAGSVGVTPKEDKHNYSKIDSQGMVRSIRKYCSQKDIVCSLTRI